MISIIVPTFNSEKTIAKTIQAIQEQETKEETELIIVDDNSTDKTVQEIKKFNKIKLIQQEKNSGPAVARNTGAKNAKGEIIIFTDSDCVPEKNWLDEMIKPFENSKVVGVQGAYKTKQKNLTAKFVQIEIEDRYDLMKKKEFIDFIGSYSAAYRKKVFLEFKGFNEKFPSASGEDPELSYRIEKKGLKLKFNPNAIVYHKHPESFLQYLKIKFFRGYWRILLYKNHQDKMIKDSYTPQILKFQIILMYAMIIGLITELVIPINFIPFYAFLLIFLVTLIPFTLKALKKDFFIGLISPKIIFFRTFAFCTGLIWGLIKVKK
ncbi:MAG: glycosyltransferase [bacterium]